MEKYFIKNGYVCNLDNENNAIEQYASIPLNNSYQISWYKFAAKIAKENNVNSCIELGSGSGYKLNKFIAPHVARAVGIDMPHSVVHCRKHYPKVEWVADDFDKPEKCCGRKFDLIISFDVIEHLVYPERLLYKIKSYAHSNSTVLISTPERDLYYGGTNHMGPPFNKKHVREWNKAELDQLLTSNGFTVKSQIILPDQEFSFRDRIWAFRNGEKAIAKRTCQLAVCVLNNQ
jgi:uncharacterized UPF0146 family protein